MSKPYHNVLAPDLMGAGLTGLFHPCAFHLELIHSAYSVHQCTWKVSDYIFCLRLVYLASMDEPHYRTQTDISPPVDTRDRESASLSCVCKCYLYTWCNKTGWSICIHIYQVSVRCSDNWLTNSHGLGHWSISRWRNSRSILICRNHLEISPGHTVGCH